MRTLIRPFLRYALVIFLLPAALMVMTWLVPVVRVDNYFMALALFVILGVLDALVRPLIVHLTLPLSVYTVGLFSLVINGFTLWLATLILPAFHIGSPFGSVIGAILVPGLVSSADRLAAGPDYGVPWRMVRRFKRKYRDVAPSSTAGLLCIEIDGLAEPCGHRFPGLEAQGTDDGRTPIWNLSDISHEGCTPPFFMEKQVRAASGWFAASSYR